MRAPATPMRTARGRVSNGGKEQNMNGKLKVVGAVFAVAAAIAVCGAVLVSLMFPAGMIPYLADKYNPLSQERTVYARLPDAEGYVESWDDASGLYRDYLYLVDASDSQGTRVQVRVIAFGSRLGDDGPDGAWIEIRARGSASLGYGYVSEAEVPEAARRVL